MPQFDPSSFASQLFWLAVSFGVLYYLMSTIALPRISDVLEERSERITDDVERAEQMKRDAEAVVAEYEAALNKARSDAAALLNATQKQIADKMAEREAAFNAELAERMQAAEARIAEARTAVVADLKTVSEDVCGAVIGRLVGERIDAATVANAVAKRMAPTAG